MSMQINRSAFVIPPTEPVGRVQERRAALKDMSQALSSDDLGAARQAYAELARNAPAGATLQAGSPFAQLGKALLQGDLEGAKKVVASIGDRPLHGRIPVPQAPSPLPTPAAPSSIGGATGSTIHLTV